MATFSGRVSKDGSITCDKEIANYLKRNGDSRVVVDIKKWPKRSLLQNNYYRLILEIIANEYGSFKEEMHDYFRELYLKDQTYIKSMDKYVTVIKSTQDLTMAEFCNYVNRVILWASNEGIIIPEATRDAFTSRNKI